MTRLWNGPHSLLALGIVALIMSAVLACEDSDSTNGDSSNTNRTSAESTETLPVPAMDSGSGNWMDVDFWRDAEVADVRAKLDRGADIHARFGSGATPLHLAAVNNSEPSVIALLLDRGVDIHARDSDDRTPLHSAAANNEEPSVIALLLDRGADINARSDDGLTPLHWAAALGENPAVIKLFLDHGANFRARNDDGETACDLVANNDALAMTEAYDLLCR